MFGGHGAYTYASYLGSSTRWTNNTYRIVSQVKHKRIKFKALRGKGDISHIL